MGLDMVLIKRYYLGAMYEWNEVTGVLDISKNGEKLPIELKNVSAIIVPVAEWRKANQIHKWFVDNVQDGNDDCKEYYVDVEQLQELLDTCKKVLENKELAPELLPSAEGFFFGPTDYGEYYFEDIEYTVNVLTELNLEAGTDHFSYYYSSSW